MIVQSGNDATIALAERIAGTEETFAQMMNANAKRLGMVGSHFGNSSGLPSPQDYTTRATCRCWPPPSFGTIRRTTNGFRA